MKLTLLVLLLSSTCVTSYIKCENCDENKLLHDEAADDDNDEYYGLEMNETSIDLNDDHYKINETENKDGNDNDDDNDNNDSNNNNDNCVCSDTFVKIIPDDFIILKCTDDKYKLFDQRDIKHPKILDARYRVTKHLSLDVVFESMRNLRITRIRLNNFIFANSNENECEFYYHDDTISDDPRSSSILTTAAASRPKIPSSSSSSSSSFSSSSFSSSSTVLVTDRRLNENEKEAADNDERQTTDYIKIIRTENEVDRTIERKFNSNYIYSVVNLPTNCEHNIEKICSEHNVLCSLSFVNDEDLTIFYLTIAATIFNSIICIVVTLIVTSILHFKRYKELKRYGSRRY
jgi:hypothetical protein